MVFVRGHKTCVLSIPPPPAPQAGFLSPRLPQGPLPRIAVGGKQPVDETDAVQLANSNGCSYARCSALTRRGLKEVFDQALKAVLTPPPRPPLRRGWLGPRAVRSLLRQAARA